MTSNERPSGPRNAEALALAEDTLQMLEVQGGPLTPVVLRCHRIARLVNSVEAENWFRCELRGYTTDITENWEPYARWSGRESSKNSEGTQQYWIGPIESIETELDLAREDLKSYQLIPMTINETTGQQNTNPYTFMPTQKSTAEKLLSSIMNTRDQRVNSVRTWSKIVGTLRGSIQEWLADTVIRLRYGNIVDSAFQRSKELFDELLTNQAPELAEQLAAAYERGASDQPEEWSQSLTSCRRALKTLADVIYPATGDSTSGHELTGDKYRNRLIQFAKENLASISQVELIEAEIDLVVRRVEALDGLASKGVHDSVDDRDVDLTIVHTYLLAGELLMLLPEDEETLQVQLPEVEEEAAPSNIDVPSVVKLKDAK